ncbi:flagellar M-ring protein FliF [candidate division KSB1 bacterium]|nr:flagellar M-ring protein FliF [candidate division KSB1 bacterium]
MGTLFQPFVELWRRLTIGQRAGLILGVAFAAAITVAAVSYSTRPVLTTMYSGLNPNDAGQIVEDLRSQKVPFELSADGTTIKVPVENVAELRLKFASAGLPTSGELGYELFDKPMLGMTDFMQRMNQHRALEGELARTIGELSSVENVRVHLVLPQPRLFREDQKPATASIILKLKPGAMLADEQVQSIVHMTAFAVEGLDVEHITVVDTRGNLLTGKPVSNDLAGLSSTQLDVQQSVESELEQKALELLENALGPGKTQVKVTAKLNWNKIERTTENYDPDRTATLSEERQESSGEANTDGTGGGTSERSVTNYQVPRTVETYVPEVGNIEHLSASVVVDGNYSTLKTADGRDSTVYTDRSPVELEKLTSLVSSAIGLDSERNDELTVVSFPLALNNAPETTTTEPGNNPMWLKLIEKFVLGLVLILIFLLARTLIGRLGKNLPALPEANSQAALPAGNMQYMLAGAAPTSGQISALAGGAAQAAAAIQGGQTGSAAPAESLEADNGPQVIFKQHRQTVEIEDAAPTFETLKHQELLKRTTDYVIKRPTNATQVLRSWILDDSEKQRH